MSIYKSKKAKGNPDIPPSPAPTYRDSVAVVKRQRQINEELSRQGYILNIENSLPTHQVITGVGGILDKNASTYEEDSRDSPMTWIDRNAQITTPGTYRADLNNGMFAQREEVYNTLNKSIPLALYHRGIEPQYLSEFLKHLNDSGWKDYYDMYSYDELATTPWRDLTEEQKKERLDKWGTVGTPYSTTPTLSQNRTIAPLPKPEPKPEPVDTRTETERLYGISEEELEQRRQRMLDNYEQRNKPVEKTIPEKETFSLESIKDVEGISKDWGRDWVSTSGQKAPTGKETAGSSPGNTRVNNPGGYYYTVRMAGGKSVVLTPEEYQEYKKNNN